MIMPSRWFAGGMGLNEFRQSMMNDKNIRKIVDYINAKECFPQLSIGGVSYFLRNSEQKETCEIINVNNGVKDIDNRKLNEFPVLVRYNKAVKIIKKIYNKNMISLSCIASALTPFGLSTSTRGQQKKDKKSTITLHSSAGISYIAKDEITKGLDLIDSYKVMISKTSAEHAGEPDKEGKYRVITKSMKILGPKEVCTHSYFIVGKYNDADTAQNLLKYLKTMFVRFLILQSLSGINLSQNVLQFIPMQDFTNDSDIDWNKSIGEIDIQLYNKYHLSKNEREYIKQKIKPME